MRACGGAQHLALGFAQWIVLDAQLDQAGPDARAIDAVAPLADPALRQLRVAFLQDVRRNEASSGRDIGSRDRQHVQTARLGQLPDHRWVSTKRRRGAVDQGAATQAMDVAQVRQHHVDDVRGRRQGIGRLLGMGTKVGIQVLMDQRHAEGGGVHGPAHRHDRATFIRGGNASAGATG